MSEYLPSFVLKQCRIFVQYTPKHTSTTIKAKIDRTDFFESEILLLIPATFELDIQLKLAV